MQTIKFLAIGTAIYFTLLYASATATDYGGCKFNSNTLRFSGTATEQANCLLRKVIPKGKGSTAQPIPDWLVTHIDKSVALPLTKLIKYLASNGIAHTDLGGTIVSGDAVELRYFVIHDTSYPEVLGAFPSNIDDAAYVGNHFNIWSDLKNKVNLIVSRDGRSHLFNDFKAHRSEAGVKIETMSRVPQSRKVFAQVENVQPRIKPLDSFAWIAPSPGFSIKQEKRLALIYIVSSVRAGRWLIPAYHFNIDQGIPNGHDDPQNTDLARWVGDISAIETEIMNTAD